MNGEEIKNDYIKVQKEISQTEIENTEEGQQITTTMRNLNRNNNSITINTQ